jgi:hypothetical protein
MGLPNLKRSITCTLSLAMVLLTTMPWTAVGQQQWTRTAFEKLFPAPGTGWSVSEMRVQESETLARDFEKMANLAGAIAGAPPVAESVRYALKREYRSGARLISMAINSEDILVLSIVLTAHGYRLDLDGKRVPLPDDQKTDRDKLLSEGIQPFKNKDHLAARGAKGSESFLAVLVGNRGGLLFECNYANCLGDVDLLMKGVDLQNLDSFARFPHRKTQ